MIRRKIIKMDKTSLGNRMKGYEGVSQGKLMRRTPVIIRIDGKAFHTFTKGMKKPFDNILNETMLMTTHKLIENIQGAMFGYTQSDEISILMIDYKNLNSDAWFDNKIQKIVSVASSMATLYFNETYRWLLENMELKDEDYEMYKQKVNKAMFDARAFNLPKEEVVNYFIWRQQDATRNSVQMLAQSLFSHKDLQGLNNKELQNKMLVEKDVNWKDVPIKFKRGSSVFRNFYHDDTIITVKDQKIPIFKDDRGYIEKFVYDVNIEKERRFLLLEKRKGVNMVISDISNELCNTGLVDQAGNPIMSNSVVDITYIDPSGTITSETERTCVVKYKFGEWVLEYLEGEPLYDDISLADCRAIKQGDYIPNYGFKNVKTINCPWLKIK